MGGGSSSPAPRNYSQETSDALRTQIQLAPQQYAAEAQYRPLYNALDLQGLEKTLNGTQAQTTTTPTSSTVWGWRNGNGEFREGDAMPQATATMRSTGQGAAGVGALYANQTPNDRAANAWTRSSVERNSSVTSTTPAQRGMLDIYENDLMPSMARMDAFGKDQQLQADMGAIDKYGRRVGDAMRDASGNTGLLRSLNAQAQEGLDAGASLDPSLRREVQQSIRAGQAARGFGYGTNDLASEAVMTAQQSQALREKRQAFGMQMVGVNQASSGDPFMALLGRPAQSTQQGQQIGSQAYSGSRTMGASLFQPESQYNADIANQYYQGQLSQNAASGANKTAMIGAGIGGAVAIGAAIF